MVNHVTALSESVSLRGFVCFRLPKPKVCTNIFFPNVCENPAEFSRNLLGNVYKTIPFAVAMMVAQKRKMETSESGPGEWAAIVAWSGGVSRA